MLSRIFYTVPFTAPAVFIFNDFPYLQEELLIFRKFVISMSSLILKSYPSFALKYPQALCLCDPSVKIRRDKNLKTVLVL